MWSWRLAGTRARAVQPASAIDANMCVAVSQSTRLCSISTVSQLKPARAMKRAAVMLPNDSQVPTAGCPALSARLTGFARMYFVLPCVNWSSIVVIVSPRRRTLQRLPLRRRHLGAVVRRLVVGDVRIVIVIVRILVFVFARLGECFRFVRRILIGHGIPPSNGLAASSAGVLL